MNRPIRLGVLISGGGTTLDNFQQKISAGELAAEVAVVIASRPDCGGVQKARNYQIPTEIVDRKNYPEVATFSDKIFAICRERNVDLVVLSGFLCLVHIPDDFCGRVLNIHPSLIPAFCGAGYYGHKVHEAVQRRGVKLSGCTVHFADNEYDHGPIILQRAVAIAAEDSPDEIARKVFIEECQAYPEAISLYASGRLSLISGRVKIAPA